MPAVSVSADSEPRSQGAAHIPFPRTQSPNQALPWDLLEGPEGLDALGQTLTDCGTAFRGPPGANSGRATTTVWPPFWD